MTPALANVLPPRPEQMAEAVDHGVSLERIHASMRHFGYDPDAEGITGIEYLPETRTVWWRDEHDMHGSSPLLIDPNEAKRIMDAECRRLLDRNWRTFARASISGWSTASSREGTRKVRERIKSDVTAWASGWAKSWMPGEDCDQKRTLMLMGKPGCGKTHLAIAAMRAVVIHGVRCNTGAPRGFEPPTWEAWNVYDLIATHKRSWDGSVPDPIPGCLTADVLVLDDIGAHRMNEFTADLLQGLINGRYQNGYGLLILTTNAGSLSKGGGVDAFWNGMLTGDSDTASMIARRVSSRLSEHSHLVPFGVMSAGGFKALPDWRREGK